MAAKTRDDFTRAADGPGKESTPEKPGKSYDNEPPIQDKKAAVEQSEGYARFERIKQAHTACMGHSKGQDYSL